MIDISRLCTYELPEARKKTGFVYVLLYKGVVIYVGETKALEERIRFHVKDKIFDEVKIEPCEIDNLKVREKQVIQFLNPLLSGQYKNRPKSLYTIVGDYIFSSPEKSVFKIVSDGEFIGETTNGKIKGKFNDDSLCFYDEKPKPFMEIVNFDRNKNEREFKRKHVDLSHEMRIEVENCRATLIITAPPAREPLYIYMLHIPDTYKFGFGIHRGKTAAQVKESDPKYIKWFEKTIDREIWGKVKNPNRNKAQKVTYV